MLHFQLRSVGKMVPRSLLNLSTAHQSSVSSTEHRKSGPYASGPERVLLRFL